jgi:hypothetical protein
VRRDDRNTAGFGLVDGDPRGAMGDDVANLVAAVEPGDSRCIAFNGDGPPTIGCRARRSTMLNARARPP